MKNLLVCGLALFLCNVALAQIPENFAPMPDALVSLIDDNDLKTTQLFINDPAFNAALKINAYEKPTALQYALYKERGTIAVAMLKGPNFGKAQWTNSQRLNVLSNAASHQTTLEALQILSTKPGFSLNLTDSGGQTVLHRAVGMGNLPAVKWLLTQKINVAAKDSDGKNALHIVNDAHSSAIARLLLATGKIDVNAQDKAGNTALHGAADFGDENTLKALLGAPKINPNLKNKAGATPLFLAASSDMSYVKILLANKKVKAGPKEQAQIKALKKAGGSFGGNNAG